MNFDWDDGFGYLWRAFESYHHTTPAYPLVRAYEITGDRRCLEAAQKWLQHQLPRYGPDQGVHGVEWQGQKAYWMGYNPMPPVGTTGDGVDNIQTLLAEPLAAVGYHTQDASMLEVAGRDLGGTLSGFEGNFALGSLRLGGQAGVGNVRLVDAFGNQPDWDGAEALYVEELILGSGSQLDLNGLTLYCLSFSDHGGTVIGGSPTQLRISGDANGDGSVDDNDLSLLLVHWGQDLAGNPDGGWGSGEFDGDPPVNDDDLSLLLTNWTGNGSVPEPVALGLFGPVAVCLLVRPQCPQKGKGTK